MINYIRFYNLKPGDEIIVPKSILNIIQHHALYIGYDQGDVHWIIDNNVGSGVRLTKSDNFFRQCLPINKINRFKGTNYERKQLVEKALKRIGKPYDMINYNCEHFTSEVKTGMKVSKQVENAILGLGLLLIISALLSE